jgi:DNA-nicking Smr family endonuclease
MDSAVTIPIEDSLDLHTFLPGDVPVLLMEYFQECRKQGLLTVRIVHGKGSGQLRRRVEACLAREPSVAEYGQAPPDMGGWGATMVRLWPLVDQT